MPFQFTPYTSPYVGSISALMQAPAAAQARAAEISGQAYGQAAQQTAQAASGAIQQAIDPRRQLEQQQVLEAKRNVQLQAAGQQFSQQANALIAKLGEPQPDGTIGIDRAKLATAMTQQGIPAEVQAEKFKTLDTIQQSIASFQQSKTDHLADLAHAALQDPDAQTPAGFMLLAGLAKANGSVTDAQTAAIGAKLAEGADPKTLLMGVRALSQKYKEENKPIALGREGSLVTPTGQVLVSPTVAPTPATLAAASTDPTKTPEQRDAAQQALDAIQKPAMAARDETARHNAEMEKIANLSQGREAARDAEMKRHNLATEAQGEAAPTLTPDAIKLTAHQFAMTGQLPPMGMGKQGAKVRTDIINAAADEYKGLDLPTQVAAYKANQQSLIGLQKQRDAIGAFENTASKNIDIFLDTAGKVVDTGSPLANTLLRQASGKVLGSPDQAAYDAARQVAVNEIAKITSNPNLSGTLSDSARKEVDAFNPQSATLAQSVRVMRVLKQDMANRAGSLDEQIKAVQGRIATPPSGSLPPNNPNQLVPPVEQWERGSDGKLHKVSG